ncbi:hypothetical protein PVK06_001117 [Gossypium arboreum]|uniref:Uncharacterized protein n=1 Tax=Gossypium arboreum TaxID=29729 RepID=A0ABR0R184_GOSAR|nr:hypothetical protein PVK06_001117 [Gossypium arboreum]
MVDLHMLLNEISGLLNPKLLNAISSLPKILNETSGLLKFLNNLVRCQESKQRSLEHDPRLRKSIWDCPPNQ